MEDRADTELGLKDYLGILKRRGLLFFLVAVPIFTIALALAFRLPTLYESTGILLVEESEVPDDLVRSTIANLPEERVRRITERVLTEENLRGIVERHDPYPMLSPDQAVRELRRSVVTGAEDPTLLPSLIAAGPTVIAFHVGVRHPDPELAYAMAEELVSLYTRENQRARQELATETLVFLESEAQRVEQRIAEREAELAEFKRRNAGRLPELSNMNMQLLTQTEQELLAADNEIRTLRERISLLESELAQLSPYAPVMDENGNVMLSPAERLKSLQRQYVRDSAIYSQEHPNIIRLQREIEALSAQTGLPGFDRATLQTVLATREQELRSARERGLTDEHPDIVRLERSVQNLRNQLDGAPAAPPVTASAPPDNPAYLQRQVQLDTARDQLQAVLARRDSLRERLAMLEERLTQTPEVEREYAALTRGLEQLTAQYNDLLSKQQAAAMSVNLESENRGDRFTILDSPDEPRRPVQPNRIAILLLGLAFAFMGGAGSIAMAETMDTTVRSPRDVSSLLEIPPLVMIPYIENEADTRAKRWKRLALAASVTAWVGVVAFLVMVPAQ
jgi:succinoglycan biosynthesis transport protein ExoP